MTLSQNNYDTKRPPMGFVSKRASAIAAFPHIVKATLDPGKVHVFSTARQTQFLIQIISAT
ncbi:hypothetical protein [Actibacterium sp. D379-3]